MTNSNSPYIVQDTSSMITDYEIKLIMKLSKIVREFYLENFEHQNIDSSS